MPPAWTDPSRPSAWPTAFQSGSAEAGAAMAKTSNAARVGVRMSVLLILQYQALFGSLAIAQPVGKPSSAPRPQEAYHPALAERPCRRPTPERSEAPPAGI